MKQDVPWTEETLQKYFREKKRLREAAKQMGQQEEVVIVTREQYNQLADAHNLAVETRKRHPDPMIIKGSIPHRP